MQKQGVGQRTVNSNPPVLRQSLKQDWKRAPLKPAKENALNDDLISQIDCFNAKSNLMTSKNPSFSLTSDYSRQYNNQSISEIKAYQKNLFCNTTNSQLSCLQSSKVGKKMADEIEELFERANNHFQKVSTKPSNVQSYKGNQMIEYKLCLAQQESAKKKNQSIGSLNRQGPSHILEQKICSEDEGMPFTTLLSYQQEEDKTDKTEEGNSFGSQSSPSPSVIESMQRQKKIEAKFRRVSNPFRSQFESKKSVVPLKVTNIKNLLTQDFEGSTFNNDKKQNLGKNFTSQRKTLGGTPDLVYFGSHFKSTDDQSDVVLNQKQLISMPSNGIRSQLSMQSQSQIKSTSKNQQTLSQSTNTTFQALKTTLKNKIIPKTSINLEEQTKSSVSSQTKLSSTKNYQSTQVRSSLRILQPAPKVSEIQLLQPKNLIEETDQDESIDSLELSSKKMGSKQSSKIFKTAMDKRQSSQNEIYSPNFSKEQRCQAYSPRQNQTMSKVFSFNESKMLGDSRNCHFTKVVSAQTACVGNTLRQSKQQLDSIRCALDQNLLSANSAAKRAKWDFSATKHAPSSTAKNSARSKDKLLMQLEQPLKRLSKEEEEQVKKEQERKKLEELQKQYLTIKKQLLEMKVDQKKKQSKNDEAEGREIVGILSSDNGDSEEDDIDEGSNNSSKYHRFSTANLREKKESTVNLSSMQNNMKAKPKQTIPLGESRQKVQNHFKSVDIRQNHKSNEPEICLSTNNPNVLKTTLKDNIKARKLEKQSYTTLKANAMKSQLQIGLRKLSYKAKDLEMEVREKRKNTEENKSQYKRKSSMKKGNRKSHHSQVSFVGVSCEDGCLSSQSSCKYKDCFSGTKYQPKQHKSRSDSSDSSKYYLANDGETLCSCCQEDFNSKQGRQKLLTCYHSQKSILNDRRDKKYQNLLDQAKHTSKKRQHDEYGKSNRKSDHRMKESSKKQERTKTSSVKNERVRSHDKLRDFSRDGGSMDRIKVSNRISETLGLWQVPQHYTQQLPFNRIRQSLDQIHQLWPNLNPNFQLQLAQQLQQSQVYPQGFQQQNFQIYLPNQQMLVPNILNQPVFTAPISLESSQHLGFQSTKDISLNKILDCRKSVESHKEHINAIESLIKMAKKKLDCNLTQKIQEPCKFSKHTHDKPRREKKDRASKHQTRNENQYYNTYDQSRVQSTGNLNCNESSLRQSAEIDHTLRNNIKFQEKYNEMIVKQRRYSDQASVVLREQRPEYERSCDKPVKKADRSGQKVIASQLEKLSSHFNTNPSNQPRDNTKWDYQVDQVTHQEKLGSFENRQSKDNRLKRIQEEEFSNERDCWQRSENKNAIKNEESTQEKVLKKAKVIHKVDLEDCDWQQHLKRKQPEESSMKSTAFQAKAHILDTLQNGSFERDDSPLKVDLKNSGKEGSKALAKTNKGGQKENWMMEFAIKEGTKNVSTKGVLNLAEAFKKKMGGSELIEQRLNSRTSQQKEKKEFSKQELLERKKELLKKARSNLHSKQQTESQTEEQVPIQTESSNPVQGEIIQNPKVVQIDISKAGKSKPAAQTKNENLTPAQLLSRLSSGQKVDISKKDMKKLTSKNYEQLPEIKRKKYEESKKEDLMKRIATVKQLEKQRRESVVKKRNAANNLVSQQSTKSAKAKEE